MVSIVSNPSCYVEYDKMSDNNEIQQMNESEFKRYLNNCSIETVKKHFDLLKAKIDEWESDAQIVMAMKYGISVEELLSKMENNKSNKSSKSKTERDNTVHGYKPYNKYKVIPWVSLEAKKTSKGALASFLKDKTSEEKKQFNTLILLESGKTTLESLIEIDPSAVKVEKNNKWVNATMEDLKKP